MQITGGEESCNCCYPMYRLKAEALRGGGGGGGGFRGERKRSRPEKNHESE